MRKLWLVIALLAATGVTTYADFPYQDSFPSSGPQLTWGYGGDNANQVVPFSPAAPGGDGYVYDVNDTDLWQTAYLGSATDTDYSVECSIYLVDDSVNWGREGLMARSQGATIYTNPTLLNGYFMFADSDDGTFRFARYDGNGATWDPHELPSSPLARNHWYRFRLEVKGDQVSCYLDGNLEQTFTDSTYAAGYFGIYNFRSVSQSTAHTYADNFIADLPPSATSTPTPTQVIVGTPTPTVPAGFPDYNGNHLVESGDLFIGSTMWETGFITPMLLDMMKEWHETPFTSPAR